MLRAVARHSPRRAPGAALLLLCSVVAAGACYEVPLPPGVVVTCEGAKGECPSGTTCRPAAHRCVANGAPTTPPALASPIAVDPSAGRAGTVFTLTVVANVSLSAAPALDVVSGGVSAPAVLDAGVPVDPAQRTFRFQYRASGAEAEGPAQATAHLVDDNGNEATISGAAMVFDFTPPVVEDVTITSPLRSAVRPDDVLVMQATAEAGAVVADAFLVDESGARIADVDATAADVTVGDAVKARVDASVDLGTVTVVDGQRIAVALVLADAVGNVTLPGQVHTAFVDVDASAPSDVGIVIAGGASTTESRDVGLVLAATGATSMCVKELAPATSLACVDGDYVPYAAAESFTLSDSVGLKSVAALFRDDADNESAVAATSITYAPVGAALPSAPTLTPPAGQTAVKHGDLVVVGGASVAGVTVQSARLVDTDASDATVADVTASVLVDAAGAYSGSVTLTRSDLDGHHLKLEVIAASGALVSTPAQSRSDPVVVDETPPPPLVTTKIVVVERSPAPDDPALVDFSHDTFTVAGLGAAAAGAARVQFFDEAACDTSSCTGAPRLTAIVDAQGAFPQQAPPPPPNKYVAVVVDGAGNTSAPVDVAAPRYAIDISGDRSGVAGDNVRSFQNGLLLDVTLVVGTGDLSNAVPFLGGEEADVGDTPPATGDTQYRYFFFSDDEVEGRDATVVRIDVPGDASVLGPGSVGTSAVTFSFDYTPPTVDVTRLVVHGNDPGVADTIEGLSGAVSDNVSLASEMTVDISVDLGVSTLPTVHVNADGSFGPVALGDNVAEDIALAARDVWRYATNVTVANDRRGPRVRAVTLTPPAVRPGAVAAVAVDIDDASDLRAPPSITVAGVGVVAAGSVSTADGAVHRFTANITAPGAAGPAPIAIDVVDVHGNPTHLDHTFTVDATPPSSTCTVPGANATWNGEPAVLGAAVDETGFIGHVDVGVHDVTDDVWWTGSSFSSPTELLLPAEGTTAWVLPFDAAALVPAHTIEIVTSAVDAAGNVEPEGVRASTAAAPALIPPPTSLVATSVDDARVRLTFTAASTAPSAYLVYYGVDDGGADPGEGNDGAEEGASPIAVPGSSTTLDVTGLLPGRYAFRVTAVDANGDESAATATVSAASRWWIFDEPPLGVPSFSAVVSSQPARFAAIDETGALYSSIDSGATWHVVNDGVAGSSGSTLAVVDGRIVTVREVDPSAGAVAIFVSDDGGVSYRAASPAFGNPGAAPIISGGGGVDVVSVGDALFSSAGGADFALSGSLANRCPFAQSAFLLGADGGRIIAECGGLSGSSGSLLQSTDGGSSFITSTLANGIGVIILRQQLLVHGDTMVVFGGCEVLRSVDAGASWSRPALEPFNGNCNTDVMVTGAVAPGLMALGATSTTLFRSVDDGNTWTPVFGAPRNSPALTSVAIAGSLGAAVGGTLALHSVDGGLTWKKSGGIDNAIDVEFVAVDGAAAVAVGAAGTIMKSDDAGATFRSQNGNTNLGLTALAQTSGGDVVATVGATGAGPVLRRAPGGVFATVTTGAEPVAAALASGDTAVVVGAGSASAAPVVARSTDGGNTWSTTTLAGAPSQLMAAGTGAGAVVIVAARNVAGALHPSIFSSVDDGATFIEIALGASEVNRQGLVGGDDGLLVVAFDDNVYATNDGATFTPHALGAVGTASTVAVRGARALVATNVDVCLSVDAATSFACQATPRFGGGGGVTSAAVLDDAFVVAQFNETDVSFDDVSFALANGPAETFTFLFDGARLFALGGSGPWESDDHGVTWVREGHALPSALNGTMRAAALRPNGDVIAVGDGGAAVTFGPP